MRCPKCNYTSFDHNEACPHCGRDLTATRDLLNLPAFAPQATTFLAALLEPEVEDFSFGETPAEHLGTYDREAPRSADDHDQGAEIAEIEELQLTPEQDEEDSGGISMEPDMQGIDFSPEEDTEISVEEEGGIEFHPDMDLEDDSAKAERAGSLEDETIIIEPNAGSDDLFLGGLDEDATDRKDVPGVADEGWTMADYNDEDDALLMQSEPGDQLSEGPLGVEETVIIHPEDMEARGYGVHEDRVSAIEDPAAGRIFDDDFDSGSTVIMEPDDLGPTQDESLPLEGDDLDLGELDLESEGLVESGAVTADGELDFTDLDLNLERAGAETSEGGYDQDLGLQFEEMDLSDEDHHSAEGTEDLDLDLEDLVLDEDLNKS